MALRAADRQAQPSSAQGVCSIHKLVVSEFGKVDAALPAGHCVALKTGGGLLRNGRAWQKITRDLFDGELIERHITVQRVDNPLPVTPGIGSRPIIKRSLAIGI